MLLLFAYLSWYISLLQQALIAFQVVERHCHDAMDFGIGAKAVQDDSIFYTELLDKSIRAKAVHADCIDVGVAHLCASQPSFYAELDFQNSGWYPRSLEFSVFLQSVLCVASKMRPDVFFCAKGSAFITVYIFIHNINISTYAHQIFPHSLANATFRSSVSYLRFQIIVGSKC